MKKSKISKYQSGGKSKMTQQELDLYNKYKGYVSSDTYRKRLQNFRTEEQAKEEQYTSLDRLKRAQPPVISPVRLPNKIQGWYENPGIILGLGNIMLSPNRDEFTYTHEMEHLNRSGGDRYNNAELSLLRSMNVNNKKFNQDQLDYLHDPTESGAKLSDIRGRAIKLGLHKNFGEEFTKEQLQAIYEQVEDDETLKFIEAYDPEVLLQALNTIADSGEQQEINIAINGGEIQESTMKKSKINKYQKGGSIKTFENDPEYFNNRTFKYWQIKALSTGEVGIDDNGVLYKLDKKVKVPQEWLDVVLGNYENSETKKKFQEQAIHEQARIGLNNFYNNPLSGIMGTGLIAPTKSVLRTFIRQGEQELTGNFLNKYRDTLQYQNGGEIQESTMKKKTLPKGTNKYQQGGIPDINQILGGFGTQFTDFMSQNPIFQNANKPPEILSEKEWRKQNGYKNFYLFGNKDQEAFRAYQANITALNTVKQMAIKALEIGR